MRKIKITPFLVINPIVIIWATHAIHTLLNRDGMAAIMSGFFVRVIVISIVLLVVDRLVLGKINLWLLSAIELIILLGALKFITSYY